MVSYEFLRPATAFPGTVLIVAPHMDDCVLACGGMLSLLPEKKRVHVVYATDGMKSPAPIFPGRDAITPDLGAIRMAEARAALHSLGVPEGNLSFLALPEAELKKHGKQLRQGLVDVLAQVQPDHIFIPFRYDRHPDHLVINYLLTTVRARGETNAVIWEYFVYYRWRLLPGGDVRAYIRPEYLHGVDITSVAAGKRAALELFASQTTRFYAWQTRPILTPQLLESVCQEPELFLRQNTAPPGAAVLRGLVLWIRLVHRLEPRLQKWRYLFFARLKRSLRRYDRNA